MDAELFANMLSDKSILDLKKLRYRYPQADMKEFVALLGNGFYKKLPLKDFDGRNLVYLESIAQVHLTAVKVLLTPQNSKQLYGMKARKRRSFPHLLSNRLLLLETVSIRFCLAMPLRPRARIASTE